MRRSPLRGYNHNIRYGGRLYHVQTEDSGVANPHVHTHLFHEGTILASRRSSYDAADDAPHVQRVMQDQHKGILRDLRDGLFDIKIAQFFGERGRRPEPETAASPSPAVASPSPAVASPSPAVASPSPAVASPSPAVASPSPAVASASPAVASPNTKVPPDPGAGPRFTEAPQRGPRQRTPARGSRITPTKQAVPTGRAASEAQPPRSAFDLPPLASAALSPDAPRGTQGSGQAPHHVHYTPTRVPAVPSSHTSQNVIVTRSVIVGGKTDATPAGPPRPAGPNTPRYGVTRPPAAPPAAAPTRARDEGGGFGREGGADKSLDDVILAYLAEDSEG